MLTKIFWGFFGVHGNFQQSFLRTLWWVSDKKSMGGSAGYPEDQPWPKQGKLLHLGCKIPSRGWGFYVTWFFTIKQTPHTSFISSFSLQKFSFGLTCGWQCPGWHLDHVPVVSTQLLCPGACGIAQAAITLLWANLSCSKTIKKTKKKAVTRSAKAVFIHKTHF